MASTDGPATEQPSETPTASNEPEWPEINEDHPLQIFLSKLDSIIEQADYDEIYGIYLKSATSFQRKLILQKFLRANANDLPKAENQFLETLKWRKSFQPLKTKDEVFSGKRFGGLGYVLRLENVPDSPNKKDIVTMNIYGAVTDNRSTFEDLEGFMRWRVGVMELSLAQLRLDKADTPIPDYGQGPDPYQCLQVHDYLNVSFLRQDPHAKAAARKAIETFQNYYPETLSRKFFVNVPVVMGWMFNTVKMFLSKETVRKFSVITYGKDLAVEIGPSLPEVYGGKGETLQASGKQLKMDDEKVVA